MVQAKGEDAHSCDYKIGPSGESEPPIEAFRVDLIDSSIHLLNFFAPAWLVAALSAAMAKLAWRQALKAVALWRLAGFAGLVGSVAWLACLFAFGRDGKMSSYAVLILCCALALWWRGFVARPGRAKR